MERSESRELDWTNFENEEKKARGGGQRGATAGKKKVKQEIGGVDWRYEDGDVGIVTVGINHRRLAAKSKQI